QGLAVREVVVCEDRDASARETRAAEETRVRERIGDDEVTRAGERRHDAEVREIAAAEDERALRPLPAREPRLELRVEGMGAGHGARGARADAVARRGLLRGRNDLRIVREREVVVAAEGDELATVAARLRRRVAIRRDELAPEPCRLETGELLARETFERVHG